MVIFMLYDRTIFLPTWTENLHPVTSHLNDFTYFHVHLDKEQQWTCPFDRNCLTCAVSHGLWTHSFVPTWAVRITHGGLQFVVEWVKNPLLLQHPRLISAGYGMSEQVKNSGAAQQQRGIGFPAETFSPRSHLRVRLSGCTYASQLHMARRPKPIMWHCVHPLHDGQYPCQAVKHPDMTCRMIHIWVPMFWNKNVEVFAAKLRAENFISILD